MGGGYKNLIENVSGKNFFKRKGDEINRIVQK